MLIVLGEAIRKLIAEDVIQFKPALRGHRTKIDAVMLSSHKKYQSIKQKYKPDEERE